MDASKRASGCDWIDRCGSSGNNLNGETTTLLRFQQLKKLFFVHMHIIIGFVIGCKITAFFKSYNMQFNGCLPLIADLHKAIPPNVRRGALQILSRLTSEYHFIPWIAYASIDIHRKNTIHDTMCL